MIKSILMATVMTFSCLVANAQTNTAPTHKSKTMRAKDFTPEQRAVRVLRMMTSQVSLADAQSADVKQILLDRENVKASARNEDGSMNKEKIADVKAANKTANEKLESVLSPEQWEKWTSFKNELKERRKANKSSGSDTQMKRPEMEEDFY